MTTARDLNQLQDIDLQIEANEKTLKRITAQLGESADLLEACRKNSESQECLGALQHEQRSLDTEAADLNSKIAESEKHPYSGRTHNPKELASLQQDIEHLKAKRGQLEEKVLLLMGQAEEATRNAETARSTLTTVESQHKADQQALYRELEQVKDSLAVLKEKRRSLADMIEPEALSVYETLRKQKGTAISPVAKGVCSRCRISLSSRELQQARSSRLVHCGNCGRILFLP